MAQEDDYDQLTATKTRFDLAMDALALGNDLLHRGHYSLAIEAFQRVLANNPISVHAHVNMAKCLEHLGRHQDAIEVLNALVSIVPHVPEPWFSLGVNHQHLDQWPQAAAVLDHLCKLEPNNPSHRWDRCQAFFSMGDFKRGYEQFEARLSSQKEFDFMRPANPPYWEGQDIKDKTLLVFGEQALGEQIMTSTMFAELRKLCGHMILEVDERLVPVMRRSFPDVEVYSAWQNGDRFSAYKRADFQTPSLQPANMLRKGFEFFPEPAVPTLTVNDEIANKFRREYEELARGRPIVGISWGSRNRERQHHKSIPLSEMSPIWEQAGAFFVSLQYDERETPEDKFDAGAIHRDASIDYYGNYDYPLAQIAACDCVVTISNTVLHSAGAISVPTMAIINSGKWRHWYWFLRRHDCPWYPSVNLFRPEPKTDGGKWYATSVQRIAQRVREMLAVAAG